MITAGRRGAAAIGGEGEIADRAFVTAPLPGLCTSREVPDVHNSVLTARQGVAAVRRGREGVHSDDSILRRSESPMGRPTRRFQKNKWPS